MTSTTGGPRLRADAERNRQRIIAGAGELIRERGPDAPMEELAQRSGVGVGTLYRRFPDRHRLVREVAVDMFRRAVDAATTAATAQPQGWSALVCLIRFCGEPEIGALSGALRGWLAEHRDDDAELRGLTATWLGHFESVVHKAQSEGAMRTDIDGVEVLRLISLVTCRMPELPAKANREATARYLDVIIDGLRG